LYDRHVAVIGDKELRNAEKLQLPMARRQPKFHDYTSTALKAMRANTATIQT